MASDIPVPGTKISPESAATQVDELLDYYDVVADDREPKDAGVIRAMRAKLVRYYQRGRLDHIRDTKGHLVVRQHLVEPPGTVPVFEYGGQMSAARVAMDAYESQAFYQRMYALMGSLSGLGETAIRALGNRDVAVMETVAQVFLVG